MVSLSIKKTLLNYLAAVQVLIDGDHNSARHRIWEAKGVCDALFISPAPTPRPPAALSGCIAGPMGSRPRVSDSLHARFQGCLERSLLGWEPVARRGARKDVPSLVRPEYLVDSVSIFFYAACSHSPAGPQPPPTHPSQPWDGAT